MWRLIAFFTIQRSAPSLINNDLNTLFPGKKKVIEELPDKDVQIKVISTKTH
jgi:hypothetical protein